MKRFISFLLIFVLLTSLLPTVSAATYSGYEGSLKWTLDTSTGRLTISGNGKMPNNTTAYDYAWFDYDSMIKSVVIESGVTSIGDYAFYMYPNLTSFRSANTVKSIGQYAFYNCDKLTTLTDTGYVTSLGRNAFYDCDALTSVTLSGQTTEMGIAVYANCDALETVTIGNGAFIGGSAFAHCPKLSNIRFSSDISYIGPAAFEDCDALTSVTLPSGLKTIDSYAFNNCNKLASVTFPEGLESIADFAFKNCDALYEVTIPASVSEIGKNPFTGCDKLIGIYIAKGNTHYQSIKDVLYNADASEIIAYPAYIGSWIYTAPNTVTSVGPYAFYECKNLYDIYFPTRLTEIKESAFENCRNLTNLNHSTLDRSLNVQTIRKNAFLGCTILSQLTLIDVELIEQNAFESCKNLSTLRISGAPKIEREAFKNCYELTSLDLGDTYEIGYRAFYDSGLRSYTLPESVRYVDREAFANCLDTNTVTVLNPGCRFNGFESSETFSGLVTQKITFHGYEDSSIKAYADLYGHSFTAHTFDENGKCTRCNYGQYTYDDGYWRYTAADGVAYIYGFGEKVPTQSYDSPQPWQDFNYAITDLVMGNDVQVISDSAFKDQKAMETLNLVNVEEIKPNAFSDCISLERLYLPDTLKTLGQKAFNGCTSLISAVLRPNLERVDYNAFAGCSSLLEVSVLNPNCLISDYQCTLGDPSITTIFGFIPSTAYNYATKYGYSFVQLSGCEYGYHSYEVASRVYATCESAGSITYQCTGCSESYTETVDALGHDIYESIFEPTCTQEGYIYESCTRCAYVKQISTIDRLEHNYVPYTLSPTCTEQGYTEYTCHGCGDSYIADYTEPTGHNYIAEIYHVTCTEDGYTRWSCHGCGDNYITDYITATGHNYTTITFYPTCTEGGYTEYRCEGCGDTYHADYTEATGHNYQYVTFHPTCTEGGYTNVFCENCNDQYSTDFTAPTGHRYDSFTTQPTCLEGGYTTHMCICGDSYITDPTEPTGHDFIDGSCHNCGISDPNSFSDVKPDSWFKSAVDYAVNNGLMNGMGNNRFEPNSAMNRAMLVTVLWRYAGQPAEGVNGFTDVPSSQWYTDAVAWASHNGIVGGVGNNRFAPNGNITREQLATILYRYCKSIGIDTTNEAILSSYPDCDKISSYAIQPLAWAVAEGLVTGTEINGRIYLDPQGNATRAQVATILMRFIENLSSDSSTDAYEAIIRQTIYNYGDEANGIVYDIDQNGDKELILMYRTDGENGSEIRYSLYVKRGDNVVKMLDDVTLYAEAGSNDGWLGIVELDGVIYFAAYCEGGLETLTGNWMLYRPGEEIMFLHYNVNFYRYLNEEGQIDYQKSYATTNGAVISYAEYESWTSAIKQIETIDSFSPDNLEALLGQLS